MSQRLLVLLFGETVGHLERETDADDPTFTYSSDYVRAADVPLSARLPLQRDTFSAARTLPFLLGLLPENRETRERWATRLGISPDDVFSMLAQMGWDCPGAVQFCTPEDLDDLHERAGDYQPVTEAHIADRLRELAVDPASWTTPDEHWSLGGQQEKFALALIGGRWQHAHGSAATTYIVKPGIRHLHHQALVEHATMRAAASVGVDVADTQLVCFEDQWAIVVERFDRILDPATNTVVRFHQEDFCQALGRRPEKKYESRGGPTLADMVRLVRRESTSDFDDRLALADFLIINVVAGAPDGHSKNISLSRTHGRTWIAPLYDLASALVYDSSEVDRSVAVSVGGERRLARIRREQWGRAARVLGLDVDTLNGRVAAIAARYPDAWRSALGEIPQAPGVEEVLERSSDPVAAHCERVLSQLG